MFIRLNEIIIITFFEEKGATTQTAPAGGYTAKLSYALACGSRATIGYVRPRTTRNGKVRRTVTIVRIIIVISNVHTVTRIVPRMRMYAGAHLLTSAILRFQNARRQSSEGPGRRGEGRAHM